MTSRCALSFGQWNRRWSIDGPSMELMLCVFKYVTLQTLTLLSESSCVESDTDSVLYIIVLLNNRQSQWPRGLRRRSTAARPLRSGVRIPPGGHGCLSVVSVVYCQVEVSATD